MMKIISILQYVGVLFLLLLSYLGGVLLYPLVYFFYYDGVKIPLWWWFDDEDGLYGAEYWRKAKGITKNNWLVSYRWCGLRNPMWNAKTKIRPISGKEVIIYAKGKLTRNGEEIALSNEAQINYEDINGRYQGNAGDIISKRFSILGWSFVWFTKKDKLYWRFSLVKNFYKGFWLEIRIGTSYRFLFVLKLKQ